MQRQQAIQVVDLGFGDSGKGTIVDFLVRHIGSDLVVRFNGGPQAGHNVVTRDGRHHTFSQFGSGTFVPCTKTFLSRFMLIEPYALFNEEAHLQKLAVADAFDRLLIDRWCAVITPIHQAANRLRELARGEGAHGTCGMGAGETVADTGSHPELVIRAAELSDGATVARKLQALCEVKVAELGAVIGLLRHVPAAAASLRVLDDPSWVGSAVDNYATLARLATFLDNDGAAKLIRESACPVFEGAQGVLLDEDFGFHPHTTWSKTTFANAAALLEESGFGGDRTRLGVLRTYSTRHGAGPFVPEEPQLTRELSEPHNDSSGCQGRFRVGPFDLVAARYALDVTGALDGLALTHADRLDVLPRRICMAYERQGERVTQLPKCDPADMDARVQLTARLARSKPVYRELATARMLPDQISGELQTPVAILSSGATAADKRIMTPKLLCGK